MTRNWISVVSREHVMVGVEASFAMQNHGELGPLTKLSPGDGLVYCSPRTSCRDDESLMAFTALRAVRDATPSRAGTSSDQTGFGRGVEWLEATETPLAPLSDRLEFTRGQWGMLARRGLFEIAAADPPVIRAPWSGTEPCR